MEISDTAADGHHVRMRFVSKQTDGKVHYWAWHKNTGGTGTITYNTTASDSRGIFDAGVQVARFEGDTLLNSCTDWN
ncbi:MULTISPECIES: hypothetical protein [unclassified Streptomyces]|uniref:hypothetical protein n=1 Tax=unclassified Streptomyces TaxID=2593676 RepID=UPI003D8C7C13